MLPIRFEKRTFVVVISSRLTSQLHGPSLVSISGFKEKTVCSSGMKMV